MKKIIALLVLFFGFNAFSQQVDLGIKAGLVYNGNSGLLETVNTTYKNRGKADVGWQAGLISRIHFLGLYLQPELLYTRFGDEYLTEENTNFTLTKNRIDLPLSLGTRLFKIVHVQLGPVFSYNFKNNNTLDVTKTNKSDFNVGLQIGVGVELGNILLSARYEYATSNYTNSFVEKATSTRYNTTTKPGILSVSLAFMIK